MRTCPVAVAVVIAIAIAVAVAVVEGAVRCSAVRYCSTTICVIQ